MAKSEVADYLTEIGRLPVLTKEAQLLHCRRINEWCTWPEGRENAPARVVRNGKRSMDLMVRTNLRLVVSIAKKYQHRGLDLTDLIQEGNLGLIRGLELFDPSRGYAVSTYAYWWIRQAITRSLHIQSRNIRLPINVHEKLSRARRFIAEFTSTHGRVPSHAQVAEAVEMTEARLHEVLYQSETTNCTSLDVSITDSGNTILESCTNPEDSVSANPESYLEVTTSEESLFSALAQLTPADEDLIRAILLEGKLITEYGKEVGESRHQIRKRYTLALGKLRRYYSTVGMRATT